MTFIWSSENKLQLLLYRGNKRKYRDQVLLDDETTLWHLVKLQGGQLNRDTILRMFVEKDPYIPRNPFTNLPLTSSELTQIFGPRTRQSRALREITQRNGLDYVEAYDAWKQSTKGRELIDKVEHEKSLIAIREDLQNVREIVFETVYDIGIDAQNGFWSYVSVDWENLTNGPLFLPETKLALCKLCKLVYAHTHPHSDEPPEFINECTNIYEGFDILPFDAKELYIYLTNEELYPTNYIVNLQPDCRAAILGMNIQIEKEDDPYNDGRNTLAEAIYITIRFS